MKTKTYVKKRKWLNKDLIETEVISYQVKLSTWYSSIDDKNQITEFEFNWNGGYHNSIGWYADIHNEKDAKEAKHKLDTLIDSLTELRQAIGESYQEQSDA